jgi:hypothetical protein
VCIEGVRLVTVDWLHAIGCPSGREAEDFEMFKQTDAIITNFYIQVSAIASRQQLQLSRNEVKSLLPSDSVKSNFALLL